MEKAKRKQEKKMERMRKKEEKIKRKEEKPKLMRRAEREQARRYDKAEMAIFLLEQKSGEPSEQYGHRTIDLWNDLKREKEEWVVKHFFDGIHDDRLREAISEAHCDTPITSLPEAIDGLMYLEELKDEVRAGFDGDSENSDDVISAARLPAIPNVAGDPGDHDPNSDLDNEAQLITSTCYHFPIPEGKNEYRQAPGDAGMPSERAAIVVVQKTSTTDQSIVHKIKDSCQCCDIPVPEIKVTSPDSPAPETEEVLPRDFLPSPGDNEDMLLLDVGAGEEIQTTTIGGKPIDNTPAVFDHQRKESGVGDSVNSEIHNRNRTGEKEIEKWREKVPSLGIQEMKSSLERICHQEKEDEDVGMHESVSEEHAMLLQAELETGEVRGADEPLTAMQAQAMARTGRCPIAADNLEVTEALLMCDQEWNPLKLVRACLPLPPAVDCQPAILTHEQQIRAQPQPPIELECTEVVTSTDQTVEIEVLVKRETSQDIVGVTEGKHWLQKSCKEERDNPVGVEGEEPADQASRKRGVSGDWPGESRRSWDPGGATSWIKYDSESCFVDEQIPTIVYDAAAFPEYIGRAHCLGRGHVNRNGLEGHWFVGRPLAARQCGWDEIREGRVWDPGGNNERTPKESKSPGRHHAISQEVNVLAGKGRAAEKVSSRGREQSRQHRPLTPSSGIATGNGSRWRRGTWFCSDASMWRNTMG